MAKKRGNLQYHLIQNLKNGESKNNNTIKTYKKGIHMFAEWVKNQNMGIKQPEDIKVEHIQAFEHYLASERLYSAYTIHTRLAPICQAAGINMADIEKPERSCNGITRGRESEANPRGRREESNERYKRVVELQKAIGVRRSELAALTPNDIIKTSNGTMWAHVLRGKGGKEQFQLILPAYQESVSNMIDGLNLDSPILTPTEMKNKINLHGLRAEHAREVYNYFNEICSSPAAAYQLKTQLKTYYKKMNPIKDENDQRHYVEFCRNLSGTYCVRGANKDKAVANGYSTIYNKLPLMATSVFSLSHWRLNVTVINYMIY